jgi:hypothetical protein
MILVSNSYGAKVHSFIPSLYAYKYVFLKNRYLYVVIGLLIFVCKCRGWKRFGREEMSEGAVWLSEGGRGVSEGNGGIIPI